MFLPTGGQVPRLHTCPADATRRASACVQDGGGTLGLLDRARAETTPGAPVQEVAAAAHATPAAEAARSTAAHRRHGGFSQQGGVSSAPRRRGRYRPPRALHARGVTRLASLRYASARIRGLSAQCYSIWRLDGAALPPAAPKPDYAGAAPHAPAAAPARALRRGPPTPMRQPAPRSPRLRLCRASMARILAVRRHQRPRPSW